MDNDTSIKRSSDTLIEGSSGTLIEGLTLLQEALSTPTLVSNNKTNEQCIVINNFLLELFNSYEHDIIKLSMLLCDTSGGRVPMRLITMGKIVKDLRPTDNKSSAKNTSAISEKDIFKIARDNFLSNAINSALNCLKK